MIFIRPHDWQAIAKALTESGNEWPWNAKMVDLDHFVRAGKVPGRRTLARRWNCSEWVARRSMTTDYGIRHMLRQATVA